MIIKDRTDFRNLIIKNKIEIAKELCKRWDCELSQQSIMVKLLDCTSIEEIYNKFLGVIYILTPEKEDFLHPEKSYLHYYLLLRQLVCKMFREKYLINNDCTEKTMKEKTEFLTEDVPKYLSSVPVPHIFLENLWDCLKQCGIDDDIIGIAWVGAINLPN
ncbi:MAG TPA: hypothetical protein VF691_20290 [Cytophagaceae bacterium]|jgi:hypothetical protein